MRRRRTARELEGSVLSNNRHADHSLHVISTGTGEDRGDGTELHKFRPRRPDLHYKVLGLIDGRASRGKPFRVGIALDYGVCGHKTERLGREGRMQRFGLRQGTKHRGDNEHRGWVLAAGGQCARLCSTHTHFDVTCRRVTVPRLVFVG